ncbi:GNAT family N-acetyltransferase [Streptomyces sp. NBC_01304]|uniref:GNAT family N-acetyltransferase n=1 Tax=Streptomyces sp. NBC_01304 TaxID=2903818 RepID=UPI002E0F70CE|nr:GNAT family N-acetyltransferase [Streptomyces sp. NBC_01304]
MSGVTGAGHGRVEIRRAGAADAPAVAALHARAAGRPDDGMEGLHSWERAILDGNGRVVCAALDEAVVAVAAFSRGEGRLEDTVTLTELHVDPAHQGRGIGSRLHAACLAHWRAELIVQAQLFVDRDNHRAREFYLSQGWFSLDTDPDQVLLHLDVESVG